MPGYPIRTPWDHSSVDSSPRPIAASHVLHRPLVPRHPPYAHSNLTTQQPHTNRVTVAQTDTYAITTNLKMLASTVQFSTNTRTPTALSAPTTQHTVRGIRAGRAPPNQPTHHQTGCRLPQDPTGCLHATTSRTGHCFPHEPPGPPYSQPQPLPAMTFASVSAIEHPTTSNAPRGPLAPLRVQALLRKEVIQPHLPVRLPCYDFVPIASPTFDGSLPTGLGHRLRVLPTFVT